MRNSQLFRLVPVALATCVTLGACTSKSSSVSETTASETTASETTVVTNESTETSSSALVVPADAVAIDYFVAKGNPPLLKETPVALTKPTKSVSMIVEKITYAGVACGFSFTGKDRPSSPVKFHFQIETADLSIVEATLDIAWVGDQEQAASAKVSGWSFVSDAQVNRNGPGWVVQVAAVPETGGKGKAIPQRALCTLSTDAEMPVTVGPVAYWAGFATV